MSSPLNLDSWIPAIWDAPSWIHAGATTRKGGDSAPPYDTFNLAMHVGDDCNAVEQNRKRLIATLALPSAPVWLQQTHGNRVIDAANPDKDMTADGSYTDQAGIVCAVLTADCVPLLLCNRNGTRIAAIHVGWRGLCAGIIQGALGFFRDPKEDILAWIGPHISAKYYEVGSEVRNACLRLLPDTAPGFTENPRGRWQANLEKIVSLVLVDAGLSAIYSAGLCTGHAADTFFSYRRHGHTGRMASLIWMENANN